MQAVLLIALITAAPPPPGTVIIFENGLLSRPIQRHTFSKLNHTAIILKDGFVYEATYPQVRKMTWKQYSDFMRDRFKRRPDLKIWLYEPKQPLAVEQLNKMQKFAESELGRKYQLRGWLRDKETRGTHCSMFASEVLKAGGLYKTDRPWKQAPVDVVRQIANTHTKKQFVNTK